MSRKPSPPAPPTFAAVALAGVLALALPSRTPATGLLSAPSWTPSPRVAVWLLQLWPDLLGGRAASHQASPAPPAASALGGRTPAQGADGGTGSTDNLPDSLPALDPNGKPR